MSDKAEIIKGDPEEVTEQLHALGYRNLYVDGGMVINSFLNAGLIDEMIITRIPILLGYGIPLFGKTTKPVKFNLVKTETINNEHVKSHYTRETG